MDVVIFNGGPRFQSGLAYSFPPLAEPHKDKEVDDGFGNTRIEHIAGWEEGDFVVFDAALAQKYGRPDGDDGSDFARLYVAANNVGYERDDPKPFSIMPREGHGNDDAATSAGKDDK